MAPRFTGRVLVDVPAVDPAFRFDQIGKALADVVTRSEPQFAVGVLGGWGTGKSTLMNEIQQNLDQSKMLVVPFNAWRYEREAHLMVPLLDAIRGRLDEWAMAHRGAERDTITGVARRVGAVVRALTRGVSAKVGVPGAFEIALDPSAAIDGLAELNGKDASDLGSSPQSLYHAAFQELAHAFAALQDARLSRIVVFVDDLDRCLPASALTVLESMKLFFDLPGFVFVVGLDERVIAQAVAAKFAEGASESASMLQNEYLKKIFQVPYRLPPMATTELDDLLLWLDRHAPLTDQQRVDLSVRVRKFLVHVAQQGRVNPREVKRFVNAYTLQRMVRPDLDPDVLLALQTLEFRGAWDEAWQRVQDVVLSEPDAFAEALNRYRTNDPNALANLWPSLELLPSQLARFLRSPEVKPLASIGSLEVYVSSLRTGSSAPTWLHDLVRGVGELRQLVRDVEEIGVAAPGMIPAQGPDPAEQAAMNLLDVLGRFSSLSSFAPDQYTRLEAPLAQVRASAEALRAYVKRDPESRGSLDGWRVDTQARISQIQEELRLIRQDVATLPS